MKFSFDTIGDPMSKELKNCPFCDEEAFSGSDDRFDWYVSCSNFNCKANVQNFITKEKATQAWNRRKP